MRLKRVNPSGPGLRRLRHGKGFRYVDDAGRALDKATVSRIKALVIPPAWEDVWISPVAHGHLQATGRDVAGRRQYLYHPAWREVRDQAKHERILDFGALLPGVRAHVASSLEVPGMGREKVLACAVRLLDLGFFRIGSEQYTDSFGLATLRKDHATVSREGVVTFDFIAKHGKHRVQAIADPSVCAIVRTLKRRSGDGTLLACKDGKRWVELHSGDINAYLREVTGGDFTAKDFRTWSATVLASVGLAMSQDVATPTARTRAVSRVMQEVSHYLGNTPTVARASYVDPRVIDLFEAGTTIRPDLLLLADELGVPATQGRIETAVLTMLRSQRAAASA